MEFLTSMRCVPLLLVACGLSGCGSEKLPESVDLHLEALQAASDGDHLAAIDLLTKALEQHRDAKTYFDRARSYLELDQTAAAIADCDAGLAMEPDDADLLWLKNEAEKPRLKRFKGRNGEQPSLNR